MIAYASNSNYLIKVSRTSWQHCMNQTALRGREDLEDEQNLHAGKAYFVREQQAQWEAAQTFLLFDLDLDPAIKLRAVTLQLPLRYDNTSVDLPFKCDLIQPWVEIQPSDWNTQALATTEQSSATIGVVGNILRFDIKLSSDQLSLIQENLVNWDKKVALRLRCDLFVPPTTQQSIVAASHDYEDPNLHPRLVVHVTDRRMQILDALSTLLAQIKEPNGYSVTVKEVYCEPVMIEAVSEAQLPLIFIYGSEEEMQPSTLGFDVSVWRLQLACAMAGYRDLLAQIYAFMDDVRRVVNAAAQQAPLLGLDFVLGLRVARATAGVDWQLTNSRALGIVEIEVQYTIDLRGGI